MSRKTKALKRQRTPDEILYEFRRRQVEARLVEALTAYKEFHERTFGHDIAIAKRKGWLAKGA